MTTYLIRYTSEPRRPISQWSRHLEHPTLAEARHNQRRLTYENSNYRFVIVTIENPTTQIYPQEFTMPWNCAVCSSEHPTSEEPMELVDDTAQSILNVCGTCYRANAINCQCCRVQLRNPAVTNNNGTHVCFECTEHHFECPLCHNRQHTDQRQTMRDRTQVCRACYDERCGTCRECSETFDAADLEDRTCRQCRRGRVIHDHSYKPRPAFQGAGPLFFGVELEVECGQRAEPADVAHEIVNEIGGGFVYAKHDGSLDHGFEIVSHPFSEDWFLSEGKERWKKILKTLRENGCRSYETETCGMHVHVSRDALDPVQLLRLQRLSHNNPDLILALSRRRRERLMQWANPRDTELPEQLQLATGRAEHKRHRYSAINVAGKTVELRIFKGTCDAEGFFGNLEAVQSLVEFCKQPLGLFPKAQSYYNFLKENRARFTNLCATSMRELVPA